MELRIFYALTLYATLIHTRKAQRPFFLLMVSFSCFWMAVYQPKDAVWVNRYAAPCMWSLLFLRASAAVEAVWQLTSHRKLRALLVGTGGLAISWVMLAWRVGGEGLGRMVQERNYLQVGMFCFLLAPLLVMWAEGEKSERMSHACILLTLLSIHASISWWLMLAGPFPPVAWRVVDAVSNLAAAGCCAAWINLRESAVAPALPAFGVSVPTDR